MTRDRNYILSPLNFVVEYMGADDRPDVAPTTWTAMAAFDQQSIADSYAKKCACEHWQYRVIDLTPVEDQP